MTTATDASDAANTPDLRQAARGLVIDDDRVVLVKWTFPTGTSAWGVPGGGLEPGESVPDGLRRELREELGLHDFEIGQLLWERTHIVPMHNGQDGQHEVVYLVEAVQFEIEPELGWAALRQEWVDEIRWWTIDEILTSDEPFVPAELPTILSDLRDGGLPTDVIKLFAHGS